MSRLIGFTGYRGCGKSTFAARLVEKHGFVRHSFAAPIRHMLSRLGLSNAELYGSLKEKPSATLLGQTPRHAMQTLSTEWGRNTIGQNIWVAAWLRQVGATLGQGKDVVVDDLRFFSELTAIHLLGGSAIRIVREATDPQDRHAKKHESEANIDKLGCDNTISNDASLEDIDQQVALLLG